MEGRFAIEAEPGKGSIIDYSVDARAAGPCGCVLKQGLRQTDCTIILHDRRGRPRCGVQVMSFSIDWSGITDCRRADSGQWRIEATMSPWPASFQGAW